MNGQIAAMPTWLASIAVGLLVLGIVLATGFLLRYTTKRPWRSSAEGVFLACMIACIDAFFVLYLVQVIWPDFPGRGTVRFGLFVGIVGAVGWCWGLLERNLRRYRRK